MNRVKFLLILLLSNLSSFAQSEYFDNEIILQGEKEYLKRNAVKTLKINETTISNKNDERNKNSLSEYDKMGNILFSEEWENNILLEKIQYFYDSIYRISLIKSHEIRNNIFFEETITYNIQNSVIKRIKKKYNSNDSLLKLTIFKYDYDKNDNLIFRERFDSLKNTRNFNYYFYNDAGKVSKVKNESMLLSNFYYDNKGNLIELVHYHNNNRTDSLTIRYGYTSENKIFKEQFLNNAGNLTYWGELIYDRFGRKVEHYTLKKNGKIIETKKYKYFNDSELLVEELWYKKKKLVKIKTLKYITFTF
jgi:hypothetical protein